MAAIASTCLGHLTMRRFQLALTVCEARQGIRTVNDGGVDYHFPAMTPDDYIGPGAAAARIKIDAMFTASGRRVQDFKQIALGAALGVAVREYPMAKGHGTADYLLFIDRSPVGVVEAKKQGTSLVEVEWQSKKYSEGVPEKHDARLGPLPFIYESTGIEARFTCGLDPEPASRAVFTFHRPETS